MTSTMTKETVQLGTVQETLLITLWARAIEARKWRPILNDWKSAEIYDRLDYDFSRFRTAPASQIGVCIRALQFDQWVRDFLREHPDGTVVEIGAGLNTRFERVDNGRVRWFDLDLPDAMTLRRRFFEESERRSFISASVLDEQWLNTVKASASGPLLLVAEGVFMYLDEADVRRLFARLAAQFPGASLVFDTMSIWWVQNQHRRDSLKHVDARIQWGIDDVGDLEWWDSGYRVEESATLGEIAHRFKRQIPIHYRVLGDLAGLIFRKQTRGYRLNLVRLGDPVPASSSERASLAGRA
jgi:O-methyltransferase involved in polyketide biosynthesis